MAVRIGELLLKEKRITPEQLQQALNHRRNGGQARLQPRQAGARQGRGDHRAPQQAVRRPLDQPLRVRDRSGGHQADSRRNRPEVPDRAAQPRRGDVDDRDGRPDQRLRHGRHQVHDRLQRRAGGGVGDGGHRGDSELLRRRRRQGAGDARCRAARARSRWRARASRRCRRSLDDGAHVEVLEELEEISAEALAKQGEEAPVVRLVNVVLMSAIQKGASDIHIEPYEKELRVRFRIDGMLYDIMARR